MLQARCHQHSQTSNLLATVLKKTKKGTESFSILNRRGVIKRKNRAPKRGKTGTYAPGGAGLPGNASALHPDQCSFLPQLTNHSLSKSKSPGSAVSSSLKQCLTPGQGWNPPRALRVRTGEAQAPQAGPRSQERRATKTILGVHGKSLPF